MVIAGSFLTFLAISVVVIVTPGQDTALTIRNTLAGGQKGGVMTALGVTAGLAVWAFATAFGVVGFLITSEPVFRRRQASRCMLHRVPRRPVALRCAASSPAGRGRSGQYGTVGAYSLRRLAPGRRMQSQQSQNSRVLCQSSPSGRTAGGLNVRYAGPARPDLFVR